MIWNIFVCLTAFFQRCYFRIFPKDRCSSQKIGIASNGLPQRFGFPELRTVLDKKSICSEARAKQTSVYTAQYWDFIQSYNLDIIRADFLSKHDCSCQYWFSSCLVTALIWILIGCWRFLDGDQNWLQRLVPEIYIFF